MSTSPSSTTVSTIPSWVSVAAVDAGAVVANVWGSGLGSEVKTAVTAVAGLVTAVVAAIHHWNATKSGKTVTLRTVADDAVKDVEKVVTSGDVPQL